MSRAMRVFASTRWSVALLLALACESTPPAPEGEAPGASSGEPSREPPAVELAPPADVVTPSRAVAQDPAPPKSETLAHGVWSLGQEVGTDMEWHDETQTGSLRAGETADLLVILYDARCYRIVAAGGEGVRDLDLFLFDPNGVLVQQDGADGPQAVLGRAHPVCVGEPGSWRVRVMMTAGEGPFALRVLRSLL